MTSILTNTAAMAALQTLRGIDRNMEITQARVSSGMRVQTAADNAAYWSIATTMRSDNHALSTIQDALGLGAAKVDTAYAAMESAIDTVMEIKSKIVAAYGVGANRNKIQEEITQLQEQLKSIADSATFSGENWLQDYVSDGGTNAQEKPVVKQVVASFTRTASGEVAVKTVDYTLDSSTVLFDLNGGKIGILDSSVRFVAETETAVTVVTTNAGVSTEADYAVPFFTESQLTALGADTNVADARIYTVGGNSYMKVAEGQWARVTTTDPATAPAVTTPVHQNGGTSYYFVVLPANNLDNRKLDISVVSVNLDKLADVASQMNTMVPGSAPDNEAVLDMLERFLDKQLLAMTSAASSLGSIQKRIDLQEGFVASLTDVIDKGVGRLVDADMNEESTRLKALQTQQQLGIQSLQIANTNAENILQLFRQ
ncbi:flagellin [Neorhizobium sp. R1-B]|uniref:flagellin N-terminal helical domain-containing protein n=1 Tax=Neorhizobium TaxID=1525371 RepID=UPI000CF96314|nr:MULTISPECIES: flagellin [Neorhizobium]TCV76089.1 flagellin [Neorhizobium sp. S3-V5DH]TDX88922.1 flagellin [Neorhizobium sp. R1-B]